MRITQASASDAPSSVKNSRTTTRRGFIKEARPARSARRLALLLSFLAAVCFAASPDATRPRSFNSTKAVTHSPQSPNSPGADGAAASPIKEAYGKLPLSFEANEGQLARGVDFAARGGGYGLYLRPDEMTLALRAVAHARPDAAGDVSDPKAVGSIAAVLRMKLAGASPTRKAEGLAESPAKVNYLIGVSPRGWHTRVPTYSAVRYREAYPGVDVVYYGNQSRLEYDFRVAPGADPRRITLAFDGITTAATDDEGDLVLETAAGEVVQRKPVAYQEAGGGRREVAVGYKVDGARARFEVGAYDASLPLVIDPVLVYSSYLGGDGDDQGLAVAVDSAGSAYVVGSTFSNDFPGPSPLQSGRDASSSDAFILKLSPDGHSLVYATYLGGDGADTANAVAVDSAGDAYVAGSTTSTNFPVTAGALQTTRAGLLDAFAAKLNASGDALVYSTYLGGALNDQIYGLAVDASGAAYLAGGTESPNFTGSALQTRAGTPVQKSTDAGANWTASSAGITTSAVNGFAVAPSDSSVVYAATPVGVFKSTDGGASWQLTGQSNAANAPGSTSAVVVDPTNANTIYAATLFSVYKSTDGGNIYALKNSGFSAFPTLRTLTVDPSSPSTLYAGSDSSGIFKTTNGGDTWAAVGAGDFDPTSLGVAEIIIDPTATQTLYAATRTGLLKTTDGGAHWSAIHFGSFGFPGTTSPVTAVALDPSHPSTLYAAALGTFGPSGPDIFKSTDGGASWSASGIGTGQVFPPQVNALLVDAASNVYAGTTNNGVFRSADGGAHWSASSSGVTNETILALAARGGNTPAILSGAATGGDAFVAKLNAAGTQLAYLRFLSGAGGDEARGVAVGADGSAYVAGTTSSIDFPTANAFQSFLKGESDAFVAKLDPSGSTVYSTYLGGSSTEYSAGVAVDSAGSAYVVGTTFSRNFPTATTLRFPSGFLEHAFVTKLSADGRSLVYSAYLGGNGFDEAHGVAVTPDGSACVTGITGSTDFPTTNGTSRNGLGGDDAFVTKLNPAGTALLFSTYLGGTVDDYGTGVALDAAGSIYVVGNTDSHDFPVVGAQQGSFGGGGADAFIARFGPGVDLSVALGDAPDPVALGGDLTYTATVKNNGELQATGVTLTDALPAGASLVSVTASQGSCSGTTTLVCSLGTMGGGASATVNITVKPPAVRTINNTATVTLNETDNTTANNSATETTTVDFADFSVSKSVLSASAAPGSKVVYFLSASNNAGALTGPVTINDTLPPELTFISCDAPHGTCGGAGNSRSVTFSSLGVGGSEPAVIVATVNPSVPVGTVVGNTAGVSASLPDPDPSNNSASASFTVAAPATPAPKSNGKIAFTTFEAPTEQIIVVNPDGSGLAPLTPGQEFDRLPAWSPDGSKLAYMTTTTDGMFFPQQHKNIVVINADGTGKVVVATNAGPEARPTWSPSGDRIAFAADDGSISVVRPDGTGPARLVNNVGPLDSLDWSPDGSKFAFTKDGGLFVMDVDGSNRQQLTERPQNADGGGDFRAAWSPDGAKILFIRSTTDGVSSDNAFAINPDGTGLTRLLNVAQINDADWSPDGTKLVYQSGSDISVANLDGSGVLLKVAADGVGPSWQPLANANPTPTPTPAQTFTISGRVTRPDGSAGSALLKLSGTRTATIGTNADGSYTFVNLPRAGRYTVTPANNLNTFTAFTPGSRSVGDLEADAAGLDFVETGVTHTLSGRVTNAQGQPLAGVTVSLIRNGQVNTTTDADGRYSFTLSQGGDGYSVQPSLSSFSFDPARAVLPAVTGDVVANFVGTPSANARGIGGRVVDAAGNAIAGLTVALGGARSAFVKTDANGFYAFANLPTGQSYTVTPSNATGFAFTQPQQTFDNFGFDSDASFTATTAQAAAQFAATDVSVAENAGSVVLTLTRAGDTSAAASVDYETSDLTASERSDYAAASGTVRFAKGEGVKTFELLVTDNSRVDGERLFRVALTSGAGVRLGAANTATVHITDDDTSASASNPVDSTRFFVTQHYADFLNRRPDSSGLDFWTQNIESCGASADCRDVKRVNTSAAFFLSIEFQETGYFVYRLHQAAFGAGRALQLRTFLKDTHEIGQGVVVGQGDWQALLESNKQAFVSDFVLRPEFLLVYPTTMTPAQFVDALNANAGGSLTSGERDSLVAALTAGTETRAAALRQLAENASFSARERNRAFVLMQYFGYLRRGPEDPPDSDFSGYDFWLSKLNQFGGNFVQAEMVKAFINSAEYRQRFGQ
jgi:uncharacterized repeat protein (TIGR01451 family)